MINTPRNPEAQNFQREFIEYRRSVVYVATANTMNVTYSQDPGVAASIQPQTAQAAPSDFAAEQRTVPQAASLSVMESVAYQEVPSAVAVASQPLTENAAMASQARYGITQAHAAMDGGSHEHPLAA